MRYKYKAVPHRTDTGSPDFQVLPKMLVVVDGPGSSPFQLLSFFALTRNSCPFEFSRIISRLSAILVFLCPCCYQPERVAFQGGASTLPRAGSDQQSSRGQELGQPSGVSTGVQHRRQPFPLQLFRSPGNARHSSPSPPVRRLPETAAPANWVRLDRLFRASNDKVAIA